MEKVQLYDYQIEAVKKLRTGSILNGGVGSGKSRTSLAYYCHATKCKKDLYIITTARKRDTKEWEDECAPFHFEDFKFKIFIDSWNNIAKYEKVEGAFFIFDEQRVVGKGAWVRSFLKIAKKNDWILLSATPGDAWIDYVPVFIANGYFKNRTQFTSEHCVFNYHTPFPKIERYVNTGVLIRYRNAILVDMDFKRETQQHHIDIVCGYDKDKYHTIVRDRWNPLEARPIESASEYCHLLRRVVNSSHERSEALVDVLYEHPKAIVFYSFDYELDILRKCDYPADTVIAEWNGHKHEPVPTSDKWVYLVNYGAGAEGWNCITTDTMIFYSQNYSYKTMEQASGRIDRLNTPFHDLFYYHFRSRSSIDNSIATALRNKKKFNERGFAEKHLGIKK